MDSRQLVAATRSKVGAGRTSIQGGEHVAEESDDKPTQIALPVKVSLDVGDLLGLSRPLTKSVEVIFSGVGRVSRAFFANHTGAL
jgi:hypothetical protein